MNISKIILIITSTILLSACSSAPELLYKDVKSSGGSTNGEPTNRIISLHDDMKIDSPNVITDDNNTAFDAVIIYTNNTTMDFYRENMSNEAITVTVSSKGKTISNSETLSSLFEAQEVDDTTLKDEDLPALRIPGSGSLHDKLREMEQQALQYNAINLNRNINYNATPKKYTCGPTGTTATFTPFTSPTPVTVRCVAESTHAYFLVDTGLSDFEIDSALQAGFDKIYKIVTSKFGPEGDIDGNGKVSILFYDMRNKSTLGYFYGGDKIPGMANDADVFYLNSDPHPSNGTTEGILDTIAHEFQHMTFFNNKIINNVGNIQDSWLNEGLSMLSSMYCDYADKGSNNDNWLENFLKNKKSQDGITGPGYSYLSLNNWTDNNYGYSAAYAYYLNDVFGEDVVKKIYENYTSSTVSAIDAVEKATADKSFLNGGNFDKIYQNFVKALFISGTGITNDPRFTFKSLDLPSITTQGTRAGLHYSDNDIRVEDNKDVTILPYSFSFIHISGPISEITITPPQILSGNNGITVFSTPLK